MPSHHPSAAPRPPSSHRRGNGRDGHRAAGSARSCRLWSAQEARRPLPSLWSSPPRQRAWTSCQRPTARAHMVPLFGSLRFLPSSSFASSPCSDRGRPHTLPLPLHLGVILSISPLNARLSPPNLGGLIIGIKWGHCPPPPDDLGNEERDCHPSWPASACLPATCRPQARRWLCRPRSHWRGGVSAPPRGAVAIPAVAPWARSPAYPPPPRLHLPPSLPLLPLFFHVIGAGGGAPGEAQKGI